MKVLTHIHASGLKQLRGVELEVPRLLALTGPNGAGKTSLQQAIRLAVLGYEPSVGKQLAATRQLAPTGEMEVGLTFADGFGIRRYLGASKATTVTPPQGERTESERDARIAAETGAFAPSFDLGEFLSLSAEKRREALFKMLPRDGAGLTETVFREWLGYDAAEDVVQRAIDKVWLERVMDAETPVDGLASAIEHVRTRFNAAEQARLDQVAVVEKADASAQAATESSEQELAAGEDIETLQAELAGASERLGELQTRLNDAVAAERRAAARETQLRDTAARLEASRDRLRVLEETVAPDVTGPAPDEVEAAAAAADAARDAVGTARLAVNTLESRQVTATQKVAAARERLLRLGSAKACPVCGTDGANLDAMRLQLEEAVAAAEVELAAVLVDRRAAESDLADRKRALEEATATRTELQQAVRAQQDAVAASAGAAAEAGTLRARIDGFEQLLAQLAREEVDTPAPVDQDALTAAIQHVSQLRAQISMEQERRHRVSHAQGKAEAERERADRERADLTVRTNRAAALKSILQALQRLRGHVIQQMIGPVEETAASILADIDPTKRFRIVFERENREVFDFGFEDDRGEFRGFIAASEGEGALLTIVFVAALIAAVQPAWPLLMIDGVEKVDDFDGVHHRRALMDALARIGHRFGNVIVAGCVDFGEPEGWTVVDVRTLGGAKLTAVPSSRPRRARRAEASAHA